MKHKGCGGKIITEDEWLKIPGNEERGKVGTYPFKCADGKKEFRDVLRCKECGKVITGDNEIDLEEK